MMPSSWNGTNILRLISSQRAISSADESKPRRELGAAHVGEQIEHVQRPAEHPHGHDVGVGVVVEAGFRCIRIAVVKLVGPHHAANLVAPALVVECGDARPEAGDLEDQLRAVELQKLDVVGDLEVLPDVVGDGAADVALQVGVVGHPALRARVQVELLGFLLAVAAALPREHRPLVTRRCWPRRAPRPGAGSGTSAAIG